MESHSLHLHEVDNDAESQENDDSSSDGLNEESDFDLESEENDDSSDSESEKSDVKEQLVCTFCDKEFKLKRNLDTRILENHQCLTFTCSICPSKFNQKKNLKRHEETVHCQAPKDVLNFSGKKKTFSCSICSERFTRQDNLDRHFSEHTVLEDKHSLIFVVKAIREKVTYKNI